jgi:hypothetical protein
MKRNCEVCQNHIFTTEDDHMVETAPVDHYPYEGEVLTIICPVCGYISTFHEGEIEL